jgi:nucleoside-diphosphate-sugar epimerase
VSRLALVTGATGFAGSHAMDALRTAGWRVRVPVRATTNRRWLPREGVECVAAEMRDPGSLRALVEGAAWVFHFGGVTRTPQREAFFRINRDGTRQLWDAAREARVELFVFCSSLAASGPAPSSDRPRREDDPPAPISAYGRSKLEAEQMLSEGGPSDAVPRVVIVRPPAIYGPRDESILAFFRWARRGLLPLPSPAGARLSLVHVRDLAQACLFLAQGGCAGLFHISDGELYTWEQVGDAAGRALGRSLRRLRIPAGAVRVAGWLGEGLGRLTGRMPVVNADKVGDILQPFWICDIAKLRDAGYTPRIGLAVGVRETVEWYRQEGWL